MFCYCRDFFLLATVHVFTHFYPLFLSSLVGAHQHPCMLVVIHPMMLTYEGTHFYVLFGYSNIASVQQPTHVYIVTAHGTYTIIVLFHKTAPSLSIRYTLSMLRIKELLSWLAIQWIFSCMLNRLRIKNCSVGRQSNGSLDMLHFPRI